MVCIGAVKHSVSSLRMCTTWKSTRRNIFKWRCAQITTDELHQLRPLSTVQYAGVIGITKDFLSFALSNSTSAEWAVAGQSQNKCRCWLLLISHILFFFTPRAVTMDRDPFVMHLSIIYVRGITSWPGSFNLQVRAGAACTVLRV